MDASLKARLLVVGRDLVDANTRAEIAQEMAQHAQEGAAVAQAEISRLSLLIEKILNEEH